MLKKLRLERFKNFKEAELVLGPLTLVVGANASGKSNIRDAFRFLHGIARGYTLADIIGEKHGEGGEVQWRGIRGGTREIAFQGSSTFALEAEFTVVEGTETRDASYRIEVDAGKRLRPPRVVAERLMIQGHEPHVFEARVDRQSRNGSVKVQPQLWHGRRPPSYDLPSHTPVLSRIDLGTSSFQSAEGELAHVARAAFSRMRFLDLSPDAMRSLSLPGQTVLGDKGQNLSSVLQAICDDPVRKATMLDWLRELTPMDARDFEFPADPAGRVLVTLIEANGQRTSAYSASDGTLRFLAMMAALLGPEPAQFYFFEELENGIYPPRLHLLLQLIEQKVRDGNIQIVASTHSPHLLGLLSGEMLEYASLVYRLEGTNDARIHRILDIPDTHRILQKQDLGHLHASGWFEDVVAFDAAASGEAAA